MWQGEKGHNKLRMKLISYNVKGLGCRVKKETRWKIDVGDKLKFWEDVWVDGESLTNLFPRLFLISDQKKEVVGKMGNWWEDG